LRAGEELWIAALAHLEALAVLVDEANQVDVVVVLVDEANQVDVVIVNDNIVVS
jgi:hypothetical protein